MSAFVLVMLPVLLALGNWQLGRAEEKRVLEDRYFDALGERPAVPGERGASQLDAFSRLELSGRYLPKRQYLVDNQIHDGEVGYWVVTVFEGLDDRRWLVNRGFVTAPGRRDQLPQLPLPAGEQSLVAVVWPELGLPPTWREEFPSGDYPRRIQRLDVRSLAALEKAEPVQLRLEARQPGSLTPASLAVDFNPAGHTGYAVQWFGLAATLAIGFVILGFRNAADSERVN